MARLRADEALRRHGAGNLSQSVPASITIVSFTGVDTSGTNGSGAIGATGGSSANPGAPTASLVTTRNTSWVFGVGIDWDRAIARTVPSNQVLVNQYLATVGDTYWVQRQSAPTAASGTTVTINATAPTTDRYNLTVVEVLATPVAGTTFSVAGAIAPASLGSAATVTLAQTGTTISTATVDASGNYLFPTVANGTYTVTPVKAGVSFSPPSQTVTVNAGAATVSPFTATASDFGHDQSSRVRRRNAPDAQRTQPVDADGDRQSAGLYSFPGLTTGSYTVTPSKAGFSFSPASQAITISTGSGTANFTATSLQSFRISGTITPVSAGSGTLVMLGSSPSRTTTADNAGNYSFTGVGNGAYTVTPSKTGFVFTPRRARSPSMAPM